VLSALLRYRGLPPKLDLIVLCGRVAQAVALYGTEIAVDAAGADSSHVNLGSCALPFLDSPTNGVALPSHSAAFRQARSFVELKAALSRRVVLMLVGLLGADVVLDRYGSLTSLGRATMRALNTIDFPDSLAQCGPLVGGPRKHASVTLLDLRNGMPALGEASMRAVKRWERRHLERALVLHDWRSLLADALRAGNADRAARALAEELSGADDEQRAVLRSRLQEAIADAQKIKSLFVVTQEIHDMAVDVIKSCGVSSCGQLLQQRRANKKNGAALVHNRVLQAIVKNKNAEQPLNQAHLPPAEQREPVGLRAMAAAASKRAANAKKASPPSKPPEAMAVDAAPTTSSLLKRPLLTPAQTTDGAVPMAIDGGVPTAPLSPPPEPAGKRPRGPHAQPLAQPAAASAATVRSPALEPRPPPDKAKPAPVDKKRRRHQRRKTSATTTTTATATNNTAKKSAFERAVARSPDGADALPDVVLVLHADFAKGKDCSVARPFRKQLPVGSFLRYMLNKRKFNRRSGLLRKRNLKIKTIKQQEHYTSATDTYLRRSKAQLNYNTKVEKIRRDSAYAEPLPTMGPDGKWRAARNAEPLARQHRRLRQRDVSASLVQAWALYQFMLGKPRPDVLSFDWEVKLRTEYRAQLATFDNDHSKALDAIVSAAVAKNTSTKKKITPRAVANALFGVHVVSCTRNQE
jgi:hypothetical protein